MALSASVVICAYTMDRWDLLRRSVGSVEEQNVRPEEVIVCIDHNPELAQRCTLEWPQLDGSFIRVVQNRFPGRLGSARNTAVGVAKGDIVAFLDDDARARPDWLQLILCVYEADDTAMVVGGSPLPEYSVPRPGWFPLEFDWVFGCAYRGLPLVRASIPHLIGASMSARRAAVLAVDGFHSDNHDDMDLCHRVAHRFGPHSIVYDPAIQVEHYVSPNRLTWSYFWRRCFFVNRGKVVAFADMKEAGNIAAEVTFGLRALFVTAPRYCFEFKSQGVRRAAATVAGVLLAGAGHLIGRFQLLVGNAQPSLTNGLSDSVGSAP